MNYVSSIKLFPNKITLKSETEFDGTYVQVLPADADNNCLEWSSSNPEIATVDTNGKITAKIPGEATIIVRNPFSGNAAEMRVSVRTTAPAILISQIEVAKTSYMMEVGASHSVSIAVSPSNASDKSLSWYSTNEEVFTVDANGNITAQGEGFAHLKIFTNDGSGKYLSCAVSVWGYTPVKSIKIIPDEKTLFVGDSDIFYAKISPSNATNTDVLWQSSDTTVVTVNEHSGLILAQSAGTATVYATACDGSGIVGESYVTVLEPIKVESITLDETKLVLYKDNTYKLAATVHPENATDKKIRWSSSKPSVATVDTYTGIVTAKAAGRVAIYATAQDGSGVQEKCTVIVKQTVVCPAHETPSNKGTPNLVEDPIDAYTGAHLLSNTLMSLFGGQSVKLIASYDSTQLACGVLGHGWHHNFEKHIEMDECDVLVYNNPSIFSRYVANSDCCSTFSCCSPNKNGYVLTIDHNREYPYIIDCNSARTECYDANGKLAKIMDHQGFEILIDYSENLVTITDGVSGKKIYLESDAEGKVTRVYDDAERVTTLTYTNQCLTSICDVNGHTLTYIYDEEGRVTSGIDSEGICYFNDTYDEYGRVIEQKDAIPGSAKSFFVYEEDTNTHITTNRNGKQSVREYDDNGLMIRYTDENGNTTTYEYDDRYNLIKETDAKGNSVIKVYNTFNKPAQVTDRNGNTTYFIYDAVGNLTAVRYPSVNGITPEELFVYNNRNQIIRHTDIRGTETIYTYDANGMPTSSRVGNKNATKFSYENGLLKSLTDAMGHTTSYSHNAIGQVISKVDADDKITEYFYDKSGNLLRTVDANGNSIVTAYDGNYLKTSVTDANGNTTLYSYNGNMKNDIITLPDGHNVSYEFDGEDRPTKVTDQAGNATTITYDDGGRVIAKCFADGSTVGYEYDEVGNVVKETNAKGATVTKTYDGVGNVLTATDDKGNKSYYEYNAMSKAVKITNAMAGTTVCVYSKAGDLLSETDALGNTKTYTYDAYGNRLTATDAKNNVTTYTYDQNNNLLTVKDALGHVTTYTYNCLNQCVTVTDALGNVIRYGYDALGRRTTVTDARGNVFTTTYDGNGNAIKTTDAMGNTVSETVYNCLNQPLTVTDAMGKTTTYTYNALGKVESVTDALSHRTEFTYNAMGQNTAVRDAASNVSTSTYDALGNVTRLEGPMGGATEYTYDDMGRLVAESTVSGGTKRYAYNELNIREQFTNARGQSRKFFYDALGRITGYTSPEGFVSYLYDANGNVLTVTDSHGVIKRTYDALNRVTSYTDTYGKTIRYEYDAVGNRSRVIYPDNTAVRYAYDENHNLIRVTDWANRVTAYTYDVNNRLIGVTKPDGSTTATVYDSKQRVTSTIEKAANGEVISGFEYIYDDLSRIIEEKVLANSSKMCYTYDSLHRVTRRVVKSMTDDTVISDESFTYDAAGNVTDAPDGCFAYDTNNRLVVFNGVNVSYDMDGNMLSNGEMCFAYDSANRLISAGGHTYVYNAEDVRIRNLCESEDTTYTYDTNAKLSQLLCKTTNGVTTKYVYGRGLIGEEAGNEFKTYHFDCRGSAIAMTDECGDITDTFAYDTYGKLISRTGTSEVVFGYNGRDGVVTDANGLIYMRARYYSPDMKRFVNADIVAGKLSNAITLNRFAYANGNPVSFVDPFGLSSVRTSESEAQTENKDKAESKINIDRADYITAYMEDTDNALYNLLKSWGVSLTKTQHQTSDYIDMFWGGFSVKLHVDVSFSIPIETDVTTDISTDSGYAIHEATTPELTLPDTDIGGKIGAYADEERLALGVSAYARKGNWTLGSKYQIGLYSEARIISLTYTPEDEYLPSVTVSLDSEEHYWVRAAVAAVVVVAIYAPQTLATVAPSAVQFIEQLESMTPQFTT